MAAGIHGFILALGLILPLGVQNLFIFNQGSLHRRWIAALPAVMTASVCDTLLISLAVLGVSVVLLASAWLKTVLLGGGMLFLLYMGYRTWKSVMDTGKKEVVERFTPRRQITFSALISLLNPHAIMDTVGVIGTSSLSYSGAAKLMFAAACILVSWLWFIGLSLAGRLVGKLDASGRFISSLNKVSAIFMWGAAVYLGVLLLKA